MSTAFLIKNAFPTRKQRSFKASTLLTGSVLALILTQPALAQSAAEDAYSAYVKDMEALGFSASNSGVSYDSGTDKLTISNEKWVFEGAYSTPETKEGEEAPDIKLPDELTYSVTISNGTTTIDGLSEADGVYSADSWMLSDDAKIEAVGAAGDLGRGKMEIRLSGMAITNYSFEMPAIPASDEGKPVSRWLPFIQKLMLQNFDETKVDTLSMTLEAYEGNGDDEKLVMSATMQMDGYQVLDSKNGQVGSYVMKKITQNILTRAEHSDDMLTQSVVQTGTVYKDINNKAFIDLFDPSVPASDEKVMVVGSQTVESYRSTQEIEKGFALQLNGGAAHAKNFYAVKRDFDFLGFFDSLIAGGEPNVEQIALGVLQLYRSFGMDEAAIKDMVIAVPNPDNPQEEIRVTLGEARMEDLSSDRIGLMKIANLAAPSLPEGVSFKLDSASFGNLEFADFGPIKDMIGKLVVMPQLAEQDPFLMARTFAPRSLSTSVEGLEVSIPGEAEVALGSYTLDLATVVAPIPTTINSKTVDLTLPVDAIEEPDTQKLLRGMGLETVTYSDELRMEWDEETQDLILENLTIKVDDLGTFEGSMRFANVARDVLEDPMGQGQMALALASFVEADLQFTDAGLTEKGLKFASEDSGITPDILKAIVVEQAVGGTAMLQNEAFSAMVREAVTSFVNNPGSLQITAKPVKSVPMTQILGAMVAPQAIPDILNIQVSAN